MQSYLAAVGAGVSLVVAIVAAAVSIWGLYHQRRAQQVEAYRAVHQLYDQMIQLKFAHPRFLVYARNWTAECMARVYRQHDTEDEKWSEYYTFVELCIGFANTVLEARDRKLIPDKEYSRQWEPLVRLVLTEHYPIISDFLKERKYVSQYLTDFVSNTSGQRPWDWRAEHASLTWAG